MSSQGLKDYSEHFKDQECKSLPRKKTGGFAPFFDANKKKYKIRSVAEGIPPLRWAAYEKLSTMFGYDATYQKLTDNLLKGKKLINEIFLAKGECNHSIIDVLQHYDSVLSGMIGFTNSRVSKGLYLCTVFIVREGEDIKEWDKDLAEEKIDDWIEEGFDVADFFTLAAHFTPAWLKRITKEMENG